MQYRQARAAGGTYFFTVNLAERDADTLVRHIDDLRKVMTKVRAAHPFAIVAMVVLPEHLHALWRLPAGDSDYPMRWSLLKAGFSRCVEKGERIRPSRKAKRERGIWPRRYWEHQIRDEADLGRPRGLHPFQPGETRLGRPACGLAPLDAARIHRARQGDRGLGWVLGRLRG
jgi:putative transposase